ncbi:MAG: heme exporter protein CcmB, partial [Chloroflexi bacterium]|nr:heme exporter protein CcmB [Chloroflexota bacterium]
GSLEGLLLCPVDRATIYWGKMVSSLLLMIAMEMIVFPLFAIFFNLPLWLPPLVIIAPLGTLGFVAVGTLFSAIAVHTRAREFMLPLLLFPILVPVVIAAVEATRTALEKGSLSGSWLPLLLAFDILFLAVSSLAFEFVVEE